MKKAVLDTSFILTCIKQKIDFFDFLKFNGFRIIIPLQVIEEIKKLSTMELKNKTGEISNIALSLLKKRKFEKISLNSSNVDLGLIKLANQEKDIIIATLDKEIKDKIKGKKIVIRGKKRIEIL